MIYPVNDLIQLIKVLECGAIAIAAGRLKPELLIVACVYRVL